MATEKDPQSQYNYLLNILERDSSLTSSVYEELMQLETNVLNIANRVADSKQADLLKDTIFYNQPLYKIMQQAANCWKNMFIEIFIHKNIYNLYEVFLEGERKIYFGLLVAAIAVFVFFVETL